MNDVVTAKQQSSTKTALDNRERYADSQEATLAALDGRQAQLHTGMPGQIVSYNAAKMTATVQLSIQAVQTQKDGTRKNISIAPIQDVPVFFPNGGGHTLTFPIAAGDECWVAFSERNIDAWYQHGEPKPPPDWRMHDINDAVCYVGLRNQSRVLGSDGSSPSASNTTTTLRSDDGKTLIQLDGPNQAITLYANGGASTVFVDGKNNQVEVLTQTLLLTANNCKLDANGNFFVTGEITRGHGTGDQVTLGQHRHGLGAAVAGTVPPTANT
jgi:hypothetical protein